MLWSAGWLSAPVVLSVTLLLAYNLFRGVYNGGIKALRTLKVDKPAPAKLDLVTMAQSAGVHDAVGVVDYFTKRFLRVAVQAGDREALVSYARSRIGSGSIDFARVGLETDLREVLHLVLSMPEYQLG